MDTKYISIGIIGFVIGLSINLSIDITDLWQESEPPEHIQRYQYIMSYQSHPIDPVWAEQTEIAFEQAIAKTQHLNLNFVKCYTDVCSFSISAAKELDSSTKAKEWSAFQAHIPEPILVSKDKRHDNGNSQNVWVYQFSNS